MHALARGDHLAVRRAVHVHDVVHEAPCGVHHAAGLDCVLFAREVVHEFHAGRTSRIVVYDPRNARLVHDRAAVLDACLCEVDRHARVVELPVVVYDAALEPLFDRSGDVFHHFLCRNEFRSAVTEAEREHVVEGQTAEIKKIIPIPVVRDHEGLVFHQMGGVRLHAAAFAQRFEHQHDVALLQVADAAVYELGTAARSAFRKVGFFEQRHAHAARRGIDGDAETRCASADHDDIPNFVFFG